MSWWPYENCKHLLDTWRSKFLLKKICLNFAHFECSQGIIQRNVTPITWSKFCFCLGMFETQRDEQKITEVNRVKNNIRTNTVLYLSRFMLHSYSNIPLNKTPQTTKPKRILTTREPKGEKLGWNQMPTQNSCPHCKPCFSEFSQHICFATSKPKNPEALLVLHICKVTDPWYSGWLAKDFREMPTKGWYFY